MVVTDLALAINHSVPMHVPGVVKTLRDELAALQFAISKAVMKDH